MRIHPRRAYTSRGTNSATATGWIKSKLGMIVSLGLLSLLSRPFRHPRGWTGWFLLRPKVRRRSTNNLIVLDPASGTWQTLATFHPRVENERNGHRHLSRDSLVPYTSTTGILSAPWGWSFQAFPGLCCIIDSTMGPGFGPLFCLPHTYLPCLYTMCY